MLFCDVEEGEPSVDRRYTEVAQACWSVMALPGVLGAICGAHAKGACRALGGEEDEGEGFRQASERKYGARLLRLLCARQRDTPAVLLLAGGEEGNPSPTGATVKLPKHAEVLWH